MAPPETDFEREAVASLLASIRGFRADSGMEPESVNWVILGHDAGHSKLAYRTGWYTEASDGMLMRLAFAGAMLTREAIPS